MSKQIACILELTEDEARAIAKLTGSVTGGGPLYRAAASVYYALHDVGFATIGTHYFVLKNPIDVSREGIATKIDRQWVSK